MTEIRINGVWAATIGGIGKPSWTTVADGGSESASWRMDLASGFTHPALRPGALVEIFAGSFGVWSGILNEPDDSPDGWEFTASGLAAEAAGYLCLDSGGNTTAVPNTAIDQAIARGLPWTRPTSLDSTSFAAQNSTDALNTLSDLLDAWAHTNSKRWVVSPSGEVAAVTDPTTPDWHLSPGSGRVGLADDEYASDLYVRYRPDAVSYATVHVADPLATVAHRREYPVDATSLGVVTSTKAANVGAGLLARGRARYGWTAPIQASRLQMTTPGGTPAYLPFVKAGQMARLHGVMNDQGLPVPYVDFVIGRTELEDGADEITIAPVNMAARTLGDVLASLGGAA